MTWEKIFIQILDEKGDIPSPFHAEGFLQHLFVIVQEDSRLGYLLIWCSITHKAVQFSRLKVPEHKNVNIITSEEFRKMEPITYELQDISVFTREMMANVKR